MELPEGVYDQLVTRALRDALTNLPLHLTATTHPLTGRDAIEYLAREVADRTRILLKSTLNQSDTGSEVAARANQLLSSIEAGNAAEQALLTRVAPTIESHPKPPILPLSQSTLVTNDQQLNYHRVLRDELLSADRVDLVCPFIGNQGLNLIFDLLRRLGPSLRIVTTTYLGGTHIRALERLAEAGAQIKIIYERPSQKTALHAKAWIFHRDSGYSTATIGSSNLSPKALVDGLEWNVRLGAKDAPQVLHGLIATFERLWADQQYENFDPARDSERVRRELASQNQSDDERTEFFADVVPCPHQVEALEALTYARLDGRHRNLIVAATGTGKTLLAAFDYERLAKEWGGLPSLLFVAHREDILQQSAGAFRAVMRDSDFGELSVGNYRAQEWRHAFASVQLLAHRDLAEFDPKRFDVVIIDEFHHSEAKTYARLLAHFQPRELLGLTATPERADGRRGEIEKLWPPTFELRLWHALERRLLCPFHYFGIDDGTDLSDLSWTTGRYDSAELERAYVDQGDARARIVIRELREKIDPADMRVVAFCASKRHADYMANVFQGAGYEAATLHSGIPSDDQRTIVRRFRRGELPIVCTVDLFNEGIDIPEINTVLFLRPTESATVYIQQLGRGLRNHRDKGALTVLDFVGQQNKKFRMDLRFRALTGLTRTELDRAVKEEFPRLPPGCDIRLDRMTTDRVLKNLRQALPSNLSELAAELRRMSVDGQRPTVGKFLTETNLEPEDLYRNGRSYLQVQKAANLLTGELPNNHHRIGSVVHADDKTRLSEYLKVVREPGLGTSRFEGGQDPRSPYAPGSSRARGVKLGGSEITGDEAATIPIANVDSRYSRMLSHLIAQSEHISVSEPIANIDPPSERTQDTTHKRPEPAIRPQVRQELAELLEVLLDRASPLPPIAADIPFALHAHYNRDEMVAPFRKNPKAMRQGTFYVKDFGLDIHLVTLRKSERDFSPTTRYDDWFEAPDVLHWESQSQTTVNSPTGHRLVRGEGRHLFFVREDREDPFLCLGFATPITHESERPIRIRWKLEHVVPDHIYVRFKGAAG